MKLYIVDEHILFREGLASMLEDQPGFTVVGQAGTLEKALAGILVSRADTVLMEINLPDGNGLEAARQLLLVRPDLKIIILTLDDSKDMLFNAIRVGVKGYLLKNSTKEQLFDSLNAIENGEAALSRKMTRTLMEEISRSGNTLQPEVNGKVELLTYRELEVLRELSTGASNQEISMRLNISENTVKSHVHHILEKLELQNRNGARVLASQLGLANLLPETEIAP
jgi:DNA-binding NarL/FixJ family response regulator